MLAAEEIALEALDDRSLDLLPDTRKASLSQGFFRPDGVGCRGWT